MSDKLRKNVLGVIFDNERNVLIVSRVNDPLHWQFPQGGINPDENMEIAIIRELQEELGTSKFTVIDKCPETHSYKWARSLIRDDNVGQVQTIFILEFNGFSSDIILDHRELGGYLWIPHYKVTHLLHEYRKPVWKIVKKYFNIKTLTRKKSKKR